MTLEEQLKKIQEGNIARAKAFADRFLSRKVNHCGIAGNVGMTAFNNPETGWGFTVQFITTPDMAQHIHAYIEFVGKEGSEDDLEAQIKKVIGV